MGKGSKSVAYSTPLAPWVEGAHKDLTSEMEKLTYGPDGAYQAFGFDSEGNRIPGLSRVASFSPTQEAAFENYKSNFYAGDPYSDFSNQQVDSAVMAADEAAMGPYFQAGRFGNQEAQSYMSPYMQQVSDFEKQAARDEFALQANRSDAERVASGARGGYREALAGFLAESEQANTIAEIEARGRQAAFENAQQQFERDRSARLQEAQFGLDRGRTLSDIYTGVARTSADLGSVAQERERQRLADLERVGNIEQAMQQQLIDVDVEDYQRYQDDPFIRMQRLQSVISGVPSDIGGLANSQSPPSLGSQLLGLGIGGISLSKLLGPQGQ
jgi:hypothetical protein